jgi:hypothetical protein
VTPASVHISEPHIVVEATSQLTMPATHFDVQSVPVSQEQLPESATVLACAVDDRASIAPIDAMVMIE